jgi:hypothetical protein
MSKEIPMSVQHIVDWSNGESYFAIVRGDQILKRLDTSSWKEAAAALRAFKSSL